MTGSSKETVLGHDEKLALLFMRTKDAMYTKDLVSDRGEQYGPPSVNLLRVARLWTTFLNTKYPSANVSVSAADVCWLNILQKAARDMHGVWNPDTADDVQGYAECLKDVQMAARGLDLDGPLG